MIETEKNKILKFENVFSKNERLRVLRSIYSLRASDRFIQPIFLRIFRGIGTFRRGNWCDICWSAATSMGDSWKRT